MKCGSRFENFTSRDDAHSPWQLMSSSLASVGSNYAAELDKRGSEMGPGAGLQMIRTLFMNLNMNKAENGYSYS